jgi:hypothetical protein
VQQSQRATVGYSNLACAALGVGHYRRAADLLAEGVQLSARAGYSRGASYIQTNMLLLDWVRGDWTGLDERARTSHPDSRLPVVDARHRLRAAFGTKR